MNIKLKIALSLTFMISTLLLTVYPASTQNTCEWTEDTLKSDKENLIDLLQCLADNESHWLLKRHFQSVKMVMQKPDTSYTDYQNELAGTLENFKNEGKLLSNYVDKDARPMIMAYTSPTDGAVSFYWLTLPDGWNESNKEYPLYVELHGSGGGKNNNPVGMLFKHLSVTTFSGTIAMQKRDGFHIFPWGRGDKFYDGIAETDVWECLDDFDGMFETDPNRQFMYGFSMGGGGTWKLAHKAVPRWAAIGMYSPYAVPTQAVANKYADTPAWVAWGDQETWAKDYGSGMRDMLTAAGDVVRWHEVPNTGHKYLGEYQVDMYEFFQAHPKSEATGIHEIELENVKIFPNPVTDDSVNIKVFEKDVFVTIADTSGRVVFETEIQGGENIYKINTANFKKGLYIISTKTGDQVSSNKLLIK